MSATLRLPSVPPRALRALPPRLASVLLLLAACVLGPVFWLAGEAPGLAARAGEPTALAIGTDGTLIVAGLLRALGLPPVAALWGASWAALPVLAALPLREGGPLLGRIATSAALASSPLVLLACASGFGWAGVGFYALWSAVLGLPERSAHQGLTRLGLGVLAAAVCCPAPWTLFLPLYAVLFAAAPPMRAPGTMRAVYLLAFAPVAAWTLTLAYAQWRSGAAGAGPLAGAGLDALPFAFAALLALVLCVACAPGLARVAPSRPACAAALLACALFATEPRVPLSLALLGAGVAQAAHAARGGGLGALALGLAAAAPLSLAIG